MMSVVQDTGLELKLVSYASDSLDAGIRYLAKHSNAGTGGKGAAAPFFEGGRARGFLLISINSF